ncbi:MAG: NAD(P)(+) transhydrogenase (Re/Si-specific) subunit alpha, partial [Chloroflexi bacterium]
MKVGVVKEILPGERRVALVPDTVAKLIAAKLEVAVQTGAGSEAFYTDDGYQKAGATMVPDARAVLSQADAVLKVQPPSLDEVAALKSGAILICFLQPSAHADVVKALATQKVTAFSLELVPRISRAQSMDALSSQAGVAGYKAVLIAANRLGKFFPLLITAAGTVRPSRVLVLGAGVAGLQAIATARRLGAVVEAYDVRPAVKDEVKSLGATFVELPLEAQAGQGGYAAQQSEEFLRRQREL